MQKPCDILKKAREGCVPKRHQSDIAVELGVTQACISKIETGENIPRPGDARRYAKAYRVPHRKLLRAVLAALQERAEAKAS